MTAPLAQGRAKRASSSFRVRLKARATCGNWRSSKWNTCEAGLTQTERVVPARRAKVALPLTSYEPQDLCVEPGGQNTPGPFRDRVGSGLSFRVSRRDAPRG